MGEAHADSVSAPCPGGIGEHVHLCAGRATDVHYAVLYLDMDLGSRGGIKVARKDRLFQIGGGEGVCLYHYRRHRLVAVVIMGVIRGEKTEPLADLLAASAACGHPDRVFMFASTSKITFPGAGIAVFASSEANIAEMQKHLSAQTICHDKLNQLRHVKFFGTPEGVRAHMQKHAAILRPKFDCVIEGLSAELSPRGIASFHKPRGGYFISLDLLKNTARRTWELAKTAGVTLTPAGATFPYGHDPDDRNLRIAPTYPSDSDLRSAVEVLCCCARLAALEKLVQA